MGQENELTKWNQRRKAKTYQRVVPVGFEADTFEADSVTEFDGVFDQCR
jgi:hypothetical protein